jgi:OOP family OmpA-OmpF porin
MNRKGLFCALALAAMPALADDAGHWYFTPQVGGLWSDNDRRIEDKDWLFGLSVGKHLNDRWSLELNVNTAELEAPGGFEVDFHAASLDLLRVFARDSAISPYITFGMGALRNDLDPGRHSDHFMAQAGVGLMARLWQNESGTRTVSLRPEVKARWDDAGRNDHFRDYLATIGLQFSFGPGRVAAAPAPEQPPAPAPAPAVEPPPAPPADSDGDGVVDSRDRCPGTPRGVAVDADGCEQKGSIVLEGVSFALNSAELTEQSRPVLARIAADLKKYPRLRVELQGHTDSSGADDYNLKLSQRRAQAVRDYLIAQGVSSEQVEARGYGETQPIASNATAEGRARNRRVVMKVLANPGDVEVVQGEQR